MPKLFASTEVDATPEEVWSLMCDAKRYHEWVVPTDSVLEAPDGPVEEGSIYREHGGIPPFKADSEWHVTVVEPITRQVHVGDDGTMNMHLEIRMTPSGTGTRLEWDIDFKPRWWMAPLVYPMWYAFMGGRGKAAMDETANNFKRLIEKAE